MFWSETHRDTLNLAMDILGPYAQILTGHVTDEEEFVPGYGRRHGRADYPVSILQASFFFSRSETIWGGTAEIQRNIVGERVLGLPQGAEAWMIGSRPRGSRGWRRTTRGLIDLVPITFAVVDDDSIVTAVDHKPKRTTRLQRLENIRKNPSVTVLVDHYDDDWSTLWWVRARGTPRSSTSSSPGCSKRWSRSTSSTEISPPRERQS